jgi:hypothetical protein
MAVGMSLLSVQFALQIAEEILYGPEKAGWAKPKIGLGADLNRDLRDRPDLTPEGTAPMGNTVPAAKAATLATSDIKPSGSHR